MQRELDQRDAEVARLREELGRSKQREADNAQLKVQIAGFKRRRDIQAMTEATLRKSHQEDRAEILRLQGLTKRQAVGLVDALGQIGDL